MAKSIETLNEEFKQKYSDRLNSNVDYKRYAMLNEEKAMHEGEIEKELAKQMQARLSNNASGMIAAEKAIEEHKNAIAMLNRFIGETDYMHAMSDEEKKAFADEYRAAVKAEITGAKLTAMQKAVNTLLEYAPILEQTAAVMRDFERYIEHTQTAPSYIEAEWNGHYSKIESLARQIAERLANKTVI